MDARAAGARDLTVTDRKLSISEERVKNIITDALADRLADVPNRLELRLTLAIGLLGGQLAATGLTALFTGLSPAQQVHAALHLASSLL